MWFVDGGGRRRDGIHFSVFLEDGRCYYYLLFVYLFIDLFV